MSQFANGVSATAERDPGNPRAWGAHAPTGLAGYLRERGFARVFLCGLATDFCVAWSALDADSSSAARSCDITCCTAKPSRVTAPGTSRVTSAAIPG